MKTILIKESVHSLFYLPKTSSRSRWEAASRCQPAPLRNYKSASHSRATPSRAAKTQEQLQSACAALPG